MFGGRSLEKGIGSLSLGSGSQHKIIVGIDYGTTFSGIGYVTTDKSDIDDITIISAWPGEPGISWKTPTRIAYKRENPKIQSNKWGFEVHPKLVSYSWTKLLLDKNAVAGEYDDPTLSNMSGHGMMQLPHFRDAEGVCEDFLHELYIYMSSKLRQQMTSSAYNNTPMECWITLPAIWSEEAKNATLQAARRAGFGSRPNDEIFTIAEPEAAAIATLKRYSVPDALNPIKPNDHILICDCGGGTVDITTYTITQVRPRLEFDELCIGVGGKCGSTYIDRNLHALLSKRFGKAFDDLAWGQKGPGSKFMTSFEMVKRDFGINDDCEVQELSPLKLDVPESEYYDEEESAVLLTYEDMKSLFDPVMTEITNLVAQQVSEAREKRRARIDRIILVGGFGDSPYLNKALAAWCLENGNITVICPEHPQAAVVRGAALRGLEGIAPRMKQARRHYGIALGLPFREGKDPEEYAYFDKFDDRKTCSHRIMWLISKGEEVFEDTFRTTGCLSDYTPGQLLRSTIKLYSSALNEPPEYCTDQRVEEVGSIVSKFDRDFDYGSSIKSAYKSTLGIVLYKVSFEVQFRFGDKGENLTFRNVVNGKVISTAVIEFNRH